MEHLHTSATVFVVRGDGVVVAGDVAANQMQDAGAAVLVFKDLAYAKWTARADPLSQPCTAPCSGNSSLSTRTKRFAFQSSRLNATSRLSLRAAMKSLPWLMMNLKFSSDENQLSISTKRNFSAF